MDDVMECGDVIPRDASPPPLPPPRGCDVMEQGGMDGIESISDSAGGLDRQLELIKIIIKTMK